MKCGLIFILVALVFSSFNAQDYWEQKDSVNGSPRSGLASFILGNRGYVVGGLDDENSTRKMYSYSSNQNDWDSELQMGGLTGGGLERNLACGFSINNKGYVCLGQGLGNAFMNDLWEYDNQSQTWTQKADFIGTARKGAVSFVLNDIAFIGTGQDAIGLCNDFYKYNPILNEWGGLSDFPGGARRQAVAFELAGYGWLGSGDAGVLKNDFWSYNPLNDEWQQKSSFPGDPRLGAVSWSNYPSGIIALGQNGNGDFLKDVWQYNYFQNQWVQKNDFGGPGRVNAFCFVLNNVPYVGAGYNGVFLDDFYSYHGLAVTEELTSSTLQVFPNPSFDYFNFHNLSPDAVIRIFNAEGKDVTQKIDREKLNVFNFSRVPSGNYFVQLIDKNGGGFLRLEKIK